MPLGTTHTITGTLEATRLGYELHVEGGGIWQLEFPHRVRPMVGARVTVEGERIGFNVLVVRGWVE